MWARSESELVTLRELSERAVRSGASGEVLVDEIGGVIETPFGVLIYEKVADALFELREALL